MLHDYAEKLDRGHLVPFTLPLGALGCLIVVSFLMIPPTSAWHSIYTRYAAFAAVFFFHTWIIRECKTLNQGAAFIVGAMACWSIVWTATLLIFHDAKRDFKRLAVVEAPTEGRVSCEKPHTSNEGVASNGTTKRHSTSRTASNADKSAERASTTHPTATEAEIYWQPYPMDSLRTRLWWCIDLFLNFRGISWNWKVRGTPSYPLRVQRSLHASSTSASTPTYTSRHTTACPLTDTPVSRSGIRRRDTLSALLMHNAALFATSYLALDVFATYMHHDAYFRTGMHSLPGPAFLPAFVRASPALLRALRLYVSMAAIRHGLRMTYALSPFFFAGVLGAAGVLGLYAQPWLYPDYYGAFSNVAARGLAGWWGAYWHMVFRAAFEAAGNWAATTVLRLRQPKRPAAAALGVALAFALSGAIHAAGSAMQNGGSSPLSGAFVFFALQPLGLGLEVAWRQLLPRATSAALPRWVGPAANLAWVFAWMWTTGGFLADDFARGGLWLAEPVMLSPMRGLGLGVDGDGFFCWSGAWLWVYRDPARWWRSGLAL